MNIEKKLTWIGILLLPIIWIACNEVFLVSERYLPHIQNVLFRAFVDIEPNIIVHTGITLTRLLIGMLLGVGLGFILGFGIYSSNKLNKLLTPSIQSLRIIPPMATVPFFILWFGFSEIGKYLIIVFGIGFNLAIAVFEILKDMPEKYIIMFKGFKVNHKKLLFSYLIPKTLEGVLPVLRFSLTVAVGLVIISELLGSQAGLGYIIQISRSTFSLHAIALATLFLGAISLGVDYLIQIVWRKLVFWKRS